MKEGTSGMNGTDEIDDTNQSTTYGAGDEIDVLMARLHAEMAAEDVPPHLRALAVELQKALDARTAKTDHIVVTTPDGDNSVPDKAPG